MTRGVFVPRGVANSTKSRMTQLGATRYLSREQLIVMDPCKDQARVWKQSRCLGFSPRASVIELPSVCSPACIQRIPRSPLFTFKKYCRWKGSPSFSPTRVLQATDRSATCQPR